MTPKETADLILMIFAGGTQTGLWPSMKQVAELARAYLSLTARLKTKCPTCEGVGRRCVHESQLSEVWDTCFECHGSGEVEQPWIAEVRKRAEAATPGPWVVNPFANPLNALGLERIPNAKLSPELWILTSYIHPQLKAQLPIITIARGPYQERPEEIHIRPQDADFIAHARADIPELLSRLAAAEHRALEAEKDRVVSDE